MAVLSSIGLATLAFLRAVRSELLHAKPRGLPGLTLDGEPADGIFVRGTPRGLGRV